LTVPVADSTLYEMEMHRDPPRQPEFHPPSLSDPIRVLFPTNTETPGFKDGLVKACPDVSDPPR